MCLELFAQAPTIGLLKSSAEAYAGYTLLLPQARVLENTLLITLLFMGKI